jgi:hypothetical protein
MSVSIWSKPLPHNSVSMKPGQAQGAHACPGATLAVAIAQAGERAVLEAGLDLASLAEGVLYRPSVNTRIPVWHGKESAS